MKKQLQNEQGLTLVEVITSLTILMMIALSVSGVVTTVINNKQFAQQKQKASMLGQEIMEEISLIDTLSKDVDGYYIPLTLGSHLKNTSDINSEIGTYTATINQYDITLDLQKTVMSETTEESDTLSQDTSSYLADASKLIIEIDGQSGSYQLKDITDHSDEHETTDEECPSLSLIGHEFEVKYDQDAHVIKIGANGNYLTSKLVTADDTLEVSLRFLKEFNPSETFKIKIENPDNARVMTLHLFKHIEVKANIDFPNPSGRIKILNNRLEGITKVGELYDFTLSLKQNNKLLFETYGTKNFIKE